MRTTLDLPEALYRRSKATAALRGSTMRELVIHALERELSGDESRPRAPKSKLPVIRKWSGPKLDLSEFDFDELLGS